MLFRSLPWLYKYTLDAVDAPAAPPTSAPPTPAATFAVRLPNKSEPVSEAPPLDKLYQLEIAFDTHTCLRHLRIHDRPCRIAACVRRLDRLVEQPHDGIVLKQPVADVLEAEHLLHGKERVAYADAGYQGVEKRTGREGPIWHVAARRGRVKALPEGELKEMTKRLEYFKSVVRSKVEHPFRVIKRQFVYQKTRYRGLTKNTSQIITLFALSNLWMARRSLLALTGDVRP